jgi:hypothetical protein
MCQGDRQSFNTTAHGMVRYARGIQSIGSKHEETILLSFYNYKHALHDRPLNFVAILQAMF